MTTEPNTPTHEPDIGPAPIAIESAYDTREPLTLSNRARLELAAVREPKPSDEIEPPVCVQDGESAINGVRHSVMTVCDPGKAKSPLTLKDIHSSERSTTEGSTSVVKPSVTPSPSLQPRLRVIRGEILNAEFPILDGKNFIGRSADTPVDIDVTAQEAIERVWSSRQHAVITFERGGVVLEDLNSLNGTFVNRARLHPGHRRTLQPGDVIQIGTVQFRLEV